MKTNDFVVKDFDGSIKVKIEDSFSKFDPDVSPKTVLASALSWSKSFNLSIREARSHFEEGALPVPYPKNKTIEEITKYLLASLNPKYQYGKLCNISKDIATKHNLTENWELSISVAIVTGVLPIAYYQSPIEAIPTYRKPEKSKVKEKGLLSESLDHIFEISNLRDRASHPCLVFKEKVSTKELIKWAKENVGRVEKITENLPDRSVTGKSLSTIYWGQVAWIILLENPQASWGQVADRAEELVRMSDDNSMDKSVYDIPEESAFRLYYERFLDTIKKHDISK